MLSTNFKRHLAFVMAMVLVLSAVPFQAFAIETGTEPASVPTTEATTEPTTKTTESIPSETEQPASVTLASVEAELNAYVERYQLRTDMTDMELADAYIALDTEQSQAAWDEAMAIDARVATLTEKEKSALSAQENTALIVRFLGTMEQINTPAIIANYPVGDVTVTTSNSVDANLKNGWRFKATGTDGFLGLNKKSATITITVTNSSSTAQILEFEWLADKSMGTTSVAGTSYTGSSTGSYSGKYTGEVTSGNSVSITATSDKGSANTVYFSIWDIKMYTVASSNITISYEKSKGTVKKSGTIFDPGTDTITDNTTYTAEPETGYAFLAWVNENGKIVGTSESYTAPADGTNQTISPIFAGTEPWYIVDQTYLYNDWDIAFGKKALDDGTTVNATYVTLANTATLPVRTDAYEIPAEKNFLIPYSTDQDFSQMNTAAAFQEPLDTTDDYGTPAAFRTLTIPSGITINCWGNVSLDARQLSTSINNTGRVNGTYGYMKLEGSLNLKSGAVLRCYGYITGGGTVTAESAATVYEFFQLMDWRGGSVTSDFYTKMKNESFLLSQFYIQNIEVPYKVYSGANSIAYVTAAAGLFTKTPYASDITLIGSKGLFKLNNGYLLRTYLSNSDRIKYEVYGGGSINSISLTMKTNMGADMTMNSADYVLNVPSSMSIHIKYGSVIECPNRIKLLPDAELNIEGGGELKLTGSAEMILYDYDDWNDMGFVWANGSGTTGDIYPCYYSPTRTKKLALSGGNSQLIVDGTLNIGDGAAVYSTNFKSTGTGNASLSGNGTITWGTAPASLRKSITELHSNGSKEFTREDTGKTNTPTVAVVLLQAPIAGTSDNTSDFTDSMADSATYYAYNDWWCTHADNLWTPASCINPKTCACEKTDGNPTGIHDWQGPTCVTAAICTVCGTEDSTRPATGVHTWDLSTGLCSVCKASMITLDATNVSVEGEVLLNLKFRILDHTDALTVTVTEQPNEVDTDGDNWTKQVSELTYEEAKGRYVVSQGIAAGEMTGSVTVSFQLNGQVIPFRTSSDATETVTELSKTVTDYAQTALDESDKENLKKMITQMVTFGGYAQQFFGTRTGSLAYSILSEVPDISNNSTTQTAKIQGDSIGIRAETQKLNLNAKIYMRTYFTLENGHNISEYTFTLTSPTGYGNSTTTTTFEPKQEGSRYYVDFENVPVAYWDDDHKITVTSSEGTYTVTSSVLAWVGRCIKNSSNPAEVNMAKAMISYNQAANTYFTAD